jgi:quaternary ammonium compound-resistance protein SugE
MAWAYLIAAGCFEVLCTTLYRYTDGLSRLWPTLAFFALGFVSFFLLNRALAGIPIGTAYAVWTGIGAAGTALVGVAFYSEPATAIRLLCLAMIIAAIVGLKLTSAH